MTFSWLLATLTVRQKFEAFWNARTLSVEVRVFSKPTFGIILM